MTILSNTIKLDTFQHTLLLNYSQLQKNTEYRSECKIGQGACRCTRLKKWFVLYAHSWIKQAQNHQPDLMLELVERVELVVVEKRTVDEKRLCTRLKIWFVLRIDLQLQLISSKRQWRLCKQCYWVLNVPVKERAMQRVGARKLMRDLQEDGRQQFVMIGWLIDWEKLFKEKTSNCWS